MISGNVSINSQHILPPVGNTKDMTTAGFGRVFMAVMSPKKELVDDQGEKKHPGFMQLRKVGGEPGLTTSQSL